MKDLLPFRKQKKPIWTELESWAADDTNILDEFGPSSFSTEQLIALKKKYLVQTEHLNAQQRLLTWFALSSLGWVVVGFLALAVKFVVMAKIIFYLSPITIMLWMGFLVIQYRRHDRIPILTERIFQIDSELRKRRDLRLQ